MPDTLIKLRLQTLRGKSAPLIHTLKYFDFEMFEIPSKKLLIYYFFAKDVTKTSFKFALGDSRAYVVNCMTFFSFLFSFTAGHTIIYPIHG